MISELQHGQVAFESRDRIQVQISQFYGIEINDFAVTVAKTALWIAESQMMKETEDVVHMSLDFLPLKSYANITEGNAMRLGWAEVVPQHWLSYIMGKAWDIKSESAACVAHLMKLYQALTEG